MWSAVTIFLEASLVPVTASPPDKGTNSALPRLRIQINVIYPMCVFSGETIVMYDTLHQTSPQQEDTLRVVEYKRDHLYRSLSPPAIGK